MARSIEAQAVISAVDKTGRTFDAVSGKIKRMQANAAAANRAGAVAARNATVVSRASAVTTRAAAGGGILAGGPRFLGAAAVGYGGVRAVKAYAEAEEQIARIGLTADATDAEIKALHKSMRDLAFATGKPFKEVSEGLGQLVSGGLDLKEATPAMPAIVKTAQAAGAEVKDIANSALALSQNLGLSAKQMQAAFDILVTGGKAGKFELKDMARYLPSIAPAAAAVGIKGEEGLKKLVAMLQVIRQGTGSSEEAAASASNIFAKMESEATVKQFKKFGINLRTEMDGARKSGKDLLSTFVQLTDKAIKGDPSKIPRLFTDMEFARGMRALVAYKDLMKEVQGKVEKSAGSVETDFKRAMNLTKTEIDKLTESSNHALEAVGRLLNLLGASKGMSAASKYLNDLLDKYEQPPLTKEQGQAKADAAVEGVTRWQEGKRLAEIETGIGMEERRLATAEAAAQRPMRATAADLNRELRAAAQATLEKLRLERDTILSARAEREKQRAATAAAAAPYPYPGRAPAHVVDRDLHFPPVPLPLADPRKVPGAIDLSDLPAFTPSSVTEPAKAEITGEATVTTRIEVAPSPDFLTRIQTMITNGINNVRVGGAPATGSSGSTGAAMPEAQPTSP